MVYVQSDLICTMDILRSGHITKKNEVNNTNIAQYCRFFVLFLVGWFGEERDSLWIVLLCGKTPILTLVHTVKLLPLRQSQSPDFTSLNSTWRIFTSQNSVDKTH